MQSAASLQFLNHEKLTFFFSFNFSFSPGVSLFVPKERETCACNWEQGKDKAMTVKSPGVKAQQNEGQILSKAGFCPCVCPVSLKLGFTVVQRI